MSTNQARGAYGDTHDGLLDPDRPTLLERATRGDDRLAEDLADRRSMSPLIQRLRASVPVALRGGR
jgi:hypothetical protein